MTVNKAIVNLVNEGVLERRQGKGTFVSYKKQKLTYEKMQGFTEIAQVKKLKVKNKDDFIHIIDYFHQNHVKVIDPRHIEDAYHQYPDDYSRQKYYKRTHKDLLKKK